MTKYKSLVNLFCSLKFCSGIGIIKILALICKIKDMQNMIPLHKSNSMSFSLSVSVPVALDLTNRRLDIYLQRESALQKYRLPTPSFV